MVCDPSAQFSVTLAPAALPHGPLHVNVSGSPSPSVATPESATLAPAAEVASTFRSGPAFTAGDELGTVRFGVSVTTTFSVRVSMADRRIAGASVTTMVSLTPIIAEGRTIGPSVTTMFSLTPIMADGRTIAASLTVMNS